MPCWVLISALLGGCGADDGGGTLHATPETTQQRVLRSAHAAALRDEVYYFPANYEVDDATVHLPLRKWDLVFAGSVSPDLGAPENRVLVSRLIPGRFDHILVYMGKDEDGFAYLAELNVDAMSLDSEGELAVAGGARLLCVGTDYAERTHPSGEHVHRRDHYAVRWARRFNAEAIARILAREAELCERFRRDATTAYPYQLEFDLHVGLVFSLSGFGLEKKILLVDDGLENGAGCSDYWTNLFEEYAGVCLPGSRMDAGEILDYFADDPEGQSAFVPAALNPTGDDDLYISELRAMGFELQSSPPHTYPCDGVTETGLVVPVRVFDSPLLTDIAPEPAPSVAVRSR